MKCYIVYPMTKRLYEKIRDIIEASPVLTQRGLAQHMGLNAAAVNRMLHGRRNIMAEEIPVIESYLGVKLTQDDVEYPQNGKQLRKGFSDVSSHMQDADAASSRVPVCGAPFSPRLGETGGMQNVIEWVQRHPAQLGVRDAFAVYMSSDEMEPRYFKGELVYVHPHRPLLAGKDCVVIHKDGSMTVRHVVSSSEGVLKAAQFNPKSQKTFSEKEIAAVYAVVGRG